MSIKILTNSKYQVNVRDETGKKIKRIFRTKRDAEAFESSIKLTKYENKLIRNGIKKSRYKIETAIEDYKNTKLDLRPTSSKKYLAVMEEFRTFCIQSNIIFVDEFSPDDATILFNLLTMLRENIRGKKKLKTRLKPKTINFFLATIRAFFQQEYIKDHIKRNPMLHIKNLKVEKKKPEYYTITELQAFFSQKMDENYRFAFLGLLHTGMRFGELSNLTWKDVDLERRLFFIRSTDSFKTKTINSERVIPISNLLFEELNKFHRNKPSNKYVFTSPNGYQLRERRLLEICKSIALEAKIKSNAFLHKFRHTYATMLIHSGVKIQDIKELLGHWSVVETERYAHNKADHLHNEISPLDKLLTQ